MTKEKRWLAYCDKCYTFQLIQTDSKREAERAAVSHMNTYQHATHIMDRKDAQR